MTVPYLTVDEYRNASHGQDTYNLVGSDLEGQNAELARKIRAASGWLESTCNCELIAARRVEILRVAPGRDELRLRPRNWLLNQLVSCELGTRVDRLTTIPITGAWIEDGQFVVPWPGQLPQLGRASRLIARVDYVPGWPNTLLAANVTAGASTLTITDPAGFTPGAGARMVGDPFRIIDGRRTEQITVVSIAGSTLTLAAPIAHDHTAGVVVSQLPDDVKEAATMATTAHLRHRSNDSIVMSQTLQPGAPGSDGFGWRLLKDAGRLLEHYTQIR